MQAFWGGILAAVISALVSIAVSLLVATRFYYRQRWWDRQAQAYADAISALSDLHFVLNEYLGFYENVTHLQEPKQKVLREKRLKAEHSLKPLAATGGFLISTKASVAILDTWAILDFEHYGHPLEGITNEIKAVEECIKTVASEARKVLKITV